MDRLPGMTPEAPATQKIPWFKLAVAAVVLVVIAAVLLRDHSPRELMEHGQALVDRGMALIRSLGPVMYFSAMVVLPAVGAPMLAFTIPAGELFAAKMTLGSVIAVTLVAVAANLALTYWVAHRALRPLVEGLLKRYGYTQQADEMTRRLLERAEGILDTGPFRENYDPQNGAGSHATDFGWSAAHLLLLFAP